MSGRHQPEHGADSAEGLASLDVYRLARAYRNLNVLAGDGAGIAPADGPPEEWEEDWARDFAAEYARLSVIAICSLCHGAGEVMGGDEYQRCPKCNGTGTE